METVMHEALKYLEVFLPFAGLIWVAIKIQDSGIGWLCLEFIAVSLIVGGWLALGAG